MRVKTYEEIERAVWWSCDADYDTYDIILQEYSKILAHQNKLDRRKICKSYRKANKKRKDLLRKKERVLRLYDTKEMGNPFWHSRSRIDRLRAYYKHYRGHKDLSDWGHGGID